MTYCTYIHIRNTDGKVFYVGAGKPRRAGIRSTRSNAWKEMVEKHGYTYEKVAFWKTQEEALSHEILLIDCFKDMGHPLVNITSGGKGLLGYKHSNEWMENHKKLHTGAKRSEETKKKMSQNSLGVPRKHIQYKCLDCQMIANNGNMTRHQKSTNHVGKEKL